MADFRIELLGPGTIPSLDAHEYIQRFHAQRKVLTTLLENDHISRLSYQRRDGERKNVEDLLYARLQALERSMENQVRNTRVIKVYYSTLENTIKNFALRESLAILRPTAEELLKTSRSQCIADTQELHEFKLFIDEFRDAITAVALQVSKTEGLLSSASIRAGAVDVTAAIWDAFSNMVATFGCQEDCMAIERSQKATAKLLHVPQDRLIKMVYQLRDALCYRELRKTLRAYLRRLATIQEGLCELDSAMLTPSPQIEMGLPVQLLWENVLQNLEILANCKPEYKITQDEVNVMKNSWVETRRVVDQVMEAGNHQAVSRDSSDIGSDTDFSDTDTDDLAQGSADASTPSTNAIESPQLIMTPTEDVDEVIGVSRDPDLTIQSTGVTSSNSVAKSAPVNAADLCKRLSAIQDRVRDDCTTIRQRFREILNLPNLNMLTVDNNPWLRPAQGSDALAQNGEEDLTDGRLRLSDVVESCWQEYVVIEGNCRTLMNDLKVYADGQLILLPAVLSGALSIIVYIEECVRSKDLRARSEARSEAVTKQHKKIYTRWERCFHSAQKECHKAQANIEELLQQEGKLEFKHFLSQLATLGCFGTGWYFWAELGPVVAGELLVTAAGVTATGCLKFGGLTIPSGLAAAGGLGTAGGLTAATAGAVATGKRTAGKMAAAGRLTTAGGLTTAGRLTADALTATGELTVAGVTVTVTGVTAVAGLTAAAGLAAYWIWDNRNYERARNMILDQIVKDTAMVDQLTQLLPLMSNLKTSLEDLKNMHKKLHDDNLIYVESYVNIKSVEVLEVMGPEVLHKWSTIRKLCDRFVRITGETLDLSAPPNSPRLY